MRTLDNRFNLIIAMPLLVSLATHVRSSATTAHPAANQELANGKEASTSNVEPQGLVLRMIEPKSSYWVGPVTFLVDAESPSTNPVVRIEFRLDGAFAWSLEKPPYRWTHDFGEMLTAHRLEVVATTRSGVTASTRIVSVAPSLQQRAGVDLILVPVSVRDAQGRPVQDLAKEDFRLFDNGVPRSITVFDAQPTPVSLVFGLDCSGSMQRYFPFVRAAAVEFIRQLPSAFQVSLLTFAEKTERVCDFTFDRSHLYYAIDRSKATGNETALLDASRRALDALRRRPGRRAVVVFTDGTDTLVPDEEQDAFASRVLTDARAAGVAFYYVGYGLIEKADLLARIAEGTGGEYVTAGGGRKIAEAFHRIGRTLETQYTLGCEAIGSSRPGEWRSLRVEVRRYGITVTARPGYASP